MNSKIISAFLILSLTLTSSCTKKEEGQNNDPSDPFRTSGLCGDNFRVINGNDCEDKNNTPVALLQIDIDGIPSAICSGTLITERTILTAAHCVDKSDGVTGILVGFPKDSDKESDFDVYEVVSFTKHHNYDGNPGNPYDIGVVILKDSVTNRTPVALIGKGAHKSAAGDKVGIYGYGKDANAQIGRLLTGKMILEEPRAFEKYSDQVLLAMYEGTSQIICSGDSGGPLAGDANGYVGIIGVNSAGDLNCSKIAVFADMQLDENLNWLLGNKVGTLPMIDQNGTRFLE